MNWQQDNFDWNQAKVFLVVAESGSFSAAARTLSMSQPTVGRQIAALESSLKLTLFERHGKELQLTQSGTLLFQHVKSMAEAASEFALLAHGFYR